MARSKNTDKICAVICAASIIITIAFCFGAGLGIEALAVDMPYVEKLFSTDRVHTIDIVVEDSDWRDMLDNAISKEYIMCSVVIDGESVRNVGLRTKGNSTLSTMIVSDSERYSFKIEFDHYDSSKSYHGLDKLALNNIAQDNTYLKDYISYKMMAEMGADAPLCSFTYITVNGEDWGLYLACEGIEEAFAQRNYGSGYGQIYKPESMSMGGNHDGEGGMHMPGGDGDFQMPERGEGDGFKFPGGGEGAGFGGDMPDMDSLPEDFLEQMQDMFEGGGFPGKEDGMGGMMGRGTDVALIYTDDEHDSYSNIFDNAKFDITDADKDRLIASIKQINEGVNLDKVINTDEVLRYFVVHNFVLNFDSYTGTMTHNYYLYEEDGQLSMIAWDYNLAFGAFSMGMGGGFGNSDATGLINYPIDDPVSGTTLEDRPMLGSLLADEEYLTLYHELFDEFIQGFVLSGDFEAMIDEAIELISPYVKKDPTAFCTWDEFTAASEELKSFVLLRGEAVSAQLSGDIPSTSQGQAEFTGEFIDGSGIDISLMGSSFGSMNNARRLFGDAETSDDASGDEPGPGEEMEMPLQRPQGGEMGDFPGAEGPEDGQGGSNATVYYLIASLIILAAGIIFAVKFK